MVGLTEPCDALRETFLVRAGDAGEALRHLGKLLFPVMLDVALLSGAREESPLVREVRAVIVDLEYTAARLTEIGAEASDIASELELVTTAVGCSQVVLDVAERLRGGLG